METVDLGLAAQLVMDELSRYQGVASWISAIVAVASIIIGFLEPDRRRKIILRDIQIFSQWIDYGDCYSLQRLQIYIEREIDSAYKSSNKVPFPTWVLILYYVSYSAWTAVLVASGFYLAAAINVAGVVLFTLLVVVVKVQFKKQETKNKAEYKAMVSQLSEKAEPIVEYLSHAFSSGMDGDAIRSMRYPDMQAAKFYADLLSDNPLDKRSLLKTFSQAACNLDKDDDRLHMS